jgi:hypothetical protein
MVALGAITATCFGLLTPKLRFPGQMGKGGVERHDAATIP